jgi:hypothetical protein
MMPRLALRAIASALLVSPTALVAQTTPAPRDASAEPPPMSAIKVDGRKLKPGSWRYTMQSTVNGQTQSLTREFSIAAARLNGAAAWVLADTKGEGAMRVADSLYLRRDDLTPLRHWVRMGELTQLVTYTNDSVVGQATVPQGSAKIATENLRGSMASGTMLEVFLKAMPLKTGWKGNMGMSAVSPRGNMIIPMTIEVSGEEAVTVPAGTFQCVVVTLRGQGTEQRAWVSKATRDIVKVAAQFTQPAIASLESVLISKKP